MKLECVKCCVQQLRCVLIHADMCKRCRNTWRLKVVCHAVDGKQMGFLYEESVALPTQEAMKTADDVTPARAQVL